jgi:hypothetical protein
VTAPVPPEQARDGRRVPVLVSIERGADAEAVAADLASIGLTVTRVLPRAGVICGDVWATMIPALDAAPGIVAVELDRPVTAAVLSPAREAAAVLSDGELSAALGLWHRLRDEDGTLRETLTSAVLDRWRSLRGDERCLEASRAFADAAIEALRGGGQ